MDRITRQTPPRRSSASTELTFTTTEQAKSDPCTNFLEVNHMVSQLLEAFSVFQKHQDHLYNVDDRLQGSTVLKQPHKDGDPEPDPEPPAAPPVIILSQSSIAAAAPHFQVPDPAYQNLQPQRATSSSYRVFPQSPQNSISPYTVPYLYIHFFPPPFRIPRSRLRETHSTTETRAMGSKSSKLDPQASNGKLQLSQKQLDKAEMQEPSNYYSHRSKSMRRKADKSGAAAAAAGSGGGGGSV
ncbi:hypothetical protein T440DRAFT_166197 [Plenodomus tracheiphilus IPT5]|uniref:Uncharacterized protein n=1 Tax=Plenodomus tracheiphilus IPT5 TaxID=1408161 RepID=A0A6A7B1B1_9PLEO|nr:hypothetical protein T440DRAFT_166197 [Plenodomus tracheiphilus IPT5]